MSTEGRDGEPVRRWSIKELSQREAESLEKGTEEEDKRDGTAGREEVGPFREQRTQKHGTR